MILWHESEEKFLKLRDKFRRIDDIIVLCENCNNKRIIKYVTWKNQMRINGNDMCSSCVAKYNRIKHINSYKNSDHKRSKKISETMKKKWSNSNDRNTYILSNGNRLSKEEFIIRSNNMHHNKYDYSLVEYNDYNTKVAIICSEHGIFEQLPSKHLKGIGCKKCGINNTKLGIDKFIEKACVIHDNKYDYSLVEYDNTMNKVIISCPKHGEFKQAPNSHLSGKGCPKCSVLVSNEHLDIFSYVKSIYNGEIIINDREVLDGLELDIYIPEKHLAIEYNGLYWHSYSEIETPEQKKKHNFKFNKCKDAGISLFYVWENLWNDKNHIIKSMIKNKLGLSSKRIYARKCDIIELDNNLFKSFMNDNHLQGYIWSNVKYGLIYDNELVCAIGFNRNKKYGWEISRFVVKTDYSVVGGMGRLFKKFLLEYNPLKVMTYASLDYSVGNAYKKLGFKVISTSKPGYFYIKNKQVFSRQQFQKHKLKEKLEIFDEALSESINMFNNGYRRIWNCGNLVLLFENTQVL